LFLKRLTRKRRLRRRLAKHIMLAQDIPAPAAPGKEHLAGRDKPAGAPPAPPPADHPGDLDP